MKVDIFDTDKKYDVIYADPPWEYKQSGGGNREVWQSSTMTPCQQQRYVNFL